MIENACTGACKRGHGNAAANAGAADGGAGGDADDAVADDDDADDEAAADDDAEAVMVLGCRGNWVRLTFDANCERWDQCALVVVNCDVADCQGCCGRNAAQIAAANVSWAAHE